MSFIDESFDGRLADSARKQKITNLIIHKNVVQNDRGY